MAGLYLHIPFCRKACSYCDFHFSTSRAMEDQMVAAIVKEITQRSDEIKGEKVMTIYFGGGTPSLLKIPHVEDLMKTIHEVFDVSANAEVTWEANPEDISVETAHSWVSLGINRLSLGVQSFYDEDLIWMNRAHNAQQAIGAIESAKTAGFSNINLDLIYGIPGMSMERWQANVERFLSLDIDHLSAYNLTIEKKTALHHNIIKGKQKPAPEEQSVREVKWLEDRLLKEGWERYEISNFCRNARYAQHNTNYWRGIKYLGFGPAAHSFSGDERRWNIANNAKYIQGVESGNPSFETESLSLSDRINECIMLGLRTQWGLDINQLKAFSPSHLDTQHITLKAFEEKGWLTQSPTHIQLTREGRLFADFIAGELFCEDNPV